VKDNHWEFGNACRRTTTYDPAYLNKMHPAFATLGDTLGSVHDLHTSMMSLSYGHYETQATTDPSGLREEPAEVHSDSEDDVPPVLSYDTIIYDRSKNLIYKNKGRNLRIYSMPNGGCLNHAILFSRKKDCPLDWEGDHKAFVDKHPLGPSHQQGQHLASAFRIPMFDIRSSEFGKALESDLDLLFPSARNPSASRSWILHDGKHAYVLQDVRSQETGFTARDYHTVMTSYLKGGLEVSDASTALLAHADKKRRATKKKVENPVNFFNF